ncbi:alpha-mannosidase [Patescibacteria group bacterium]|nr:alpha-mannosidase [Patescibacteria group bacterium]
MEGEKEYTIFMVGHAHIDAAWLWPVSETVEVCRSTFSSVLQLMKKYPCFCFSQSSAQCYEWMEKRYPEIFEQIKKQVKEEKWEIVGGMWIEADCNLPSGESLVRQILYGKKYFLDKFGVDVEVAWLPDTFGFCWTLPQILKKCGIDYFVTSKLNWQTTLPFPHNVFWWQSPDGSKVLACQTVGSYNHTSLKGLPNEFDFLRKQQGIPSLLFLYGCGDHGGGPTSDLIEEILKLRAQQSELGMLLSRADDYFHKLKKINQEGKAFPVVNDELYLKTHRGTYTTQAKAKLNNRKGEILLENAEKFASMAGGCGFTYPQEELEGAWKKLLFNQFHDILAGSSIPEVYETSEKEYAEIFKVGEKSLSSSLKQIAKNVDTQGKGSSVLVFNPLSWQRDGLVGVELFSLGNPKFVRILDEQERIIPCQIVEGAKNLVFLARNVFSLGYKEYKIIPIKEKKCFSTDIMTICKKDTLQLENKFYRVSIEVESGLLTSIYDKLNKKELLANSKKGGLFHIYEDFSLKESAWNIWLGALHELDRADEVSIVEQGPVRVSVRIKHIYKQKGRPDSVFVQEVRLYSDMPLVEFEVNVDWHAQHRTAKVAFPLNLYADEATYDIPYGTIERKNPTSSQANSTERAKWEVSGLKWMDYTDKEKNYGVSLLSQCKYGFDVKGNLMRMTLLRSPDYPDRRNDDPDHLIMELPALIEDQGRHTFSYALYPHKGSWKEAGSNRKGYEFNYPLLVLSESSHKGNLPKSFSFVKVYPETVILETIKKAEDSASAILRFYETIGQKTQIEILFSEPPSEVWETDMMERKISKLSIQGKSLRVGLGAYEIKTIQTRLWQKLP